MAAGRYDRQDVLEGRRGGRSQFNVPALPAHRGGPDDLRVPDLHAAPELVNVELDGGHLVIHGERRDEHADEKDGRTVREVRYGSFRRSFKLPAHVVSDAISASYDKGVLTVRVAGAYAGTQAQRIAIENK